MRVRISLLAIFILFFVIFNGIPGILYYSLLLICALSLIISAIVCIRHRDDKKTLTTELISDGIILVICAFCIIKLVKMK